MAACCLSVTLICRGSIEWTYSADSHFTGVYNFVFSYYCVVRSGSWLLWTFSSNIWNVFIIINVNFDCLVSFWLLFERIIIFFIIFFYAEVIRRVNSIKLLWVSFLIKLSLFKLCLVLNIFRNILLFHKRLLFITNFALTETSFILNWWICSVIY